LTFFYSIDLGIIDIRQNIVEEIGIIRKDVEKDLVRDIADDDAVVGCSTTTADLNVNDNVNSGSLKVKRKKRKNFDEQYEQKGSNNDFQLALWSPPARRLRSKQRHAAINDNKSVTSNKEKSH
jgi:hypothetical protein